MTSAAPATPRTAGQLERRATAALFAKHPRRCLAIAALRVSHMLGGWHLAHRDNCGCVIVADQWWFELRQPWLATADSPAWDYARSKCSPAKR